MRPEPAAGMRAAYDGLMRLIAGQPRDGAAAPSAGALVEGDGRASAGERVHVYAHMYRSRIAEALESQFPRLAKALGGDRFGELAVAYAADHPSRNPSLRFIGQHLPAWLEQPDRARPGGDGDGDGGGDDDWLAALARLEWARADVFDAPDEPPLTIDALRAHPPDGFGELPLRSIAAHRIVAARHAIADAWDAIGAGAEVPAAAIDTAGAIGTAAAGQSLLVWRQGVVVYHRAVDADEAAALDRVARGTTFGAVCEDLAARAPSPDAAAAQAFAWLSTWTADELLVAIPRL